MYRFIVNPNSRSGKSRELWEKLKDRLDREQVPYTAYLTEYAGHARRLAETLSARREPDTLVVLGGDGTLNEVINGLSVSAPLTLAYIPSGSGNDFSRGMGIPRRPEKALERILGSSRVRYVDYGILSCQTSGQPLHRRFLVSSGAGYDAEVCRNIFTTGLKPFLNRLHLGKLSYLLIGIKQIVLCRGADGCLTIDGVKKLPLKQIRFISAHIQKYEGGGFCFAPGADPADGLLELCVVSGVSRLKLTLLLTASLFGKHTSFKGVRTYSCKEASLSSGRPIQVHTDGEDCGLQTEISFHCERRKLRFLY